MRSVFTYRDLRLEYFSFGTGPNTILCFPGFGRTAEDFEIFVPLLLPGQRMIAINLFAHEGSIFPQNRVDSHPLNHNEWVELLEAFITKLGVRHFHLVGYSMGARVCLMTMQLMPEKVKSILLLAPDGLKINLLYKFAIGTSLGRKIYRDIIENPSALFSVAKWLNKFGIINNKLNRFVHVHLDTREKRQLVHDAWIIYQLFFPDLQKLASMIRENKVKKFDMIFGHFDSVIKPKLGKKFSSMIGNLDHMHLMPLGHRLLTEATREMIRSKKLWPEDIS